MVININQSLVETSNVSSTLQYLQELLLEADSTQVHNREDLLKLALWVLEVGDFQQRWEITKVLIVLGDIAIAPLVDILKAEAADAELRWYAARTLAEFHHQDIVVALGELLISDVNDELKTIAATALSKMGNLAIATFCELLTQEETRLLAVQSLSQIRDPHTIAPLLSVVNDPKVAVRAAAIAALSSFHDSRVYSVLLTALDDVATSVRSTAVLGLGFRRDLKDKLDLVTHLQPSLYDVSLEVCRAAILTLSQLGGDAAALSLFQVLVSPYTPVTLQIEVIHALSSMGTPGSLAYLQQALKQSSSEIVWEEIVPSLGRVQQQLATQATEILLEILHLSHPNMKITNIRCAIALSLGQLGQVQAIEPLISLLAEPDLRLKLYVIAALKKLPGDVTYKKLQELANNPKLTPNLRQGIELTLIEW